MGYGQNHFKFQTDARVSRTAIIEFEFFRFRAFPCLPWLIGFVRIYELASKNNVTA